MERLTENKIVLIRRKTRLDELIARYNTVMQARFYVEHMGGDFSDLQREHDQYQRALDETRKNIARIGRLQEVDRAFLSGFIFGAQDIVVAIGQDGLVANTLKYLNGQPLIGVNPDPERWDGVLLPFSVSGLKTVLPQAIGQTYQSRKITMGKVTLNDGQTLLAVNDFFIGQKTHVSARYRISVGGNSEYQSSSGIIVSTGLGASGWLKSVLAGATGISGQFSGKKMKMQPSREFHWDSDYLCYSVREPFPSKTTGVSLVFGSCSEKTPLTVQSQMGENGVIFSDGVESDFLVFNSGIEARVGIAEQKGILVVRQSDQAD